MENILAILLTGGDEDRLHPLTRETAKAGIPFGGSYRIIDFAISNCVNSDLKRILIVTHGKSAMLDRYVRESWNILSPELGEYVEPVPPAKSRYAGNVDSVYQNIRSITGETPDLVVVAAGDQIYKMDYRPMVEWHRSHTADITIATMRVAANTENRYAIASVGPDLRVTALHQESGKSTGEVTAAMGIYLFSTEVLVRELERDANKKASSHDFGRDLLPNALEQSRVLAYDFVDLNRKTLPYWRDIASVDAWYEANMDLVRVHPELNLYDSEWPILARVQQQPPAKFVFGEEGQRIGIAVDSIVGAGAIVSGGRVRESVLSSGVRVNSFSDVERSILLPDAYIGRNAQVRNAIVCGGTGIPAGIRVGFDADEDRARGYLVTPGGRTVVFC